MKKYSVLLGALFLVLGLTTPAKAAVFSVEDLLAATKIAVADFVKANPEHAEHFYGYKSWLSGDESKVKVYVKHDGMTMDFDFMCHKHTHGTEVEIECHAQ